ncbi:nuclear pore complex-interacting protein family member B3-like isoform X2 [Rhinatrema bivittatum]|nr:nuclear pore complex-interacting protein family member B3-like isoform X2 [Rhinatrema bivittatum]
MAESSLYRFRLQAITEKRKVQEEIEKRKQELEDERLKLQQLKRKSVRDRWLMEGTSPPSEDCDPSSPLWQTQSRIQQLQDTLLSLQSQASHLESRAMQQYPPKAAPLPAGAARVAGTEPPAATMREHLPEKREPHENGDLHSAVLFVVDGDTEDDVMTHAPPLTGEVALQTLANASCTGKKASGSEPATTSSTAEQTLNPPSPGDQQVGSDGDREQRHGQASPAFSQIVHNSSPEETGSDSESLWPPLLDGPGTDETLTLDTNERKLSYPLQLPASALPAMPPARDRPGAAIRAERVLVVEDEGEILLKPLEHATAKGQGIADTPTLPEARGELIIKQSSPGESTRASLNHQCPPDAATQQGKLASPPAAAPSVIQGQVSGAQEEKAALREQLTATPGQMSAIQENLPLQRQMQEQIHAAPMQQAPISQEQILTLLDPLPPAPEDKLPTVQEQILSAQQAISIEQAPNLDQLPSLEQLVPSVPEDKLPTVQEQILSAQHTDPMEPEPIFQEQFPSAEELAPEDKQLTIQEQILSAQHTVPLEQAPILQEQILTLLDQLPSAEEQLPLVLEDKRPTDQEQILSAQQAIPLEQAPILQEQILTLLDQLPSAEEQFPSVLEDKRHTDQEQILLAQQAILMEQTPILDQLAPSVPEDKLPTVQEQILSAQHTDPMEPEPIFQEQFPSAEELAPEDKQLTIQVQIPSAQQAIPLEQAPILQEQILTLIDQLPSVPENKRPTDQEQILSAQQAIPLEQAPILQEQILTLLDQLSSAEEQLPSFPEDKLSTKANVDLEPAFSIAKATKDLEPEQQPLLQEAKAPVPRALLDENTAVLPNAAAFTQPSAQRQEAATFTSSSANTAQAAHSKNTATGADGRGHGGTKQKTCHCCSVM